MIIVISNRQLRGRADGRSRALSFLGKDLSTRGNSYGRLVQRNTRIELYDEHNKAELFERIVSQLRKGDTRLNRPWLLFLHGNNQSTAKNIAKAVDIERLHKVNVIAFSWPSQPCTGRDDVVLKRVKKQAAKQLIRRIGGNRIVDAALSKLAGKSEEYLRNYLLARIHAEKSPADFIQALTTLNALLLKPAGKRLRLSFLCHSLGHYLLQNTLQHYRLPLRFHNIVLHQADVDADNHAAWSKQLTRHASRVAITSNRYDYALIASHFVNRTPRLGQDPGPRRCGKCLYLDFTDAADTSDENEHEFFLLPPRRGKTWTNQTIFNTLGQLIRSEKPSLGAGSGWRRTAANRYRLAEIISPVDDETAPG